ncbi:MAG: type II toxin-antitoxin system RelE/ParE family toxin [Chloroflexi bacterium]|nr:MAG: type II toxin-antitoxin system RelE/ParE family toxin [Chloroflexota bacterium]
MPYDVILSPQAVDDLRRLSARERALIRDVIENHLQFEPDRESKSRIKRLRQLVQPQYRLRIDEYRVFYDIVEDTVYVFAIVPKSRAARWLDDWGKSE